MSEPARSGPTRPSRHWRDRRLLQIIEQFGAIWIYPAIETWRDHTEQCRRLARRGLVSIRDHPERADAQIVRFQPIGSHCPVDLQASDELIPYVCLLWRRFDPDDVTGTRERGERIHGFDQCPKCGVWWPCIEEPDGWELNADDEVWLAISWWGGTICEDCGLLMVTQPDGTPETYRLSGWPSKAHQPFPGTGS